jgi:hypothetical protein
MKSIEMDNPNPLKHLGADLNPPLGVVSYNLKWFQPFIIVMQSFQSLLYYFVNQKDKAID